MVSAMHKQTAFTVMATVCAIIGVVLWEVGVTGDDRDASTVESAFFNKRRADWSNFYEAALVCSVAIACYIRFWASYYAPNKINRALTITCILLFAAVVAVLVKTAPCGTAYTPYKPCFEVMTGVSFGFALLDLVIFLVWKCLFHVVGDAVAADAAAAAADAPVKVADADVEAAVEKKDEAKTDAAKEKEEEAKKEEEKEKEDKEEKKEDKDDKEDKEEKKEDKEDDKQEATEAEPLLKDSEEKKEEEKKE